MTHRKLFFGIVALAVLLSVQTGISRAEAIGSAIVPHTNFASGTDQSTAAIPSGYTLGSCFPMFPNLRSR